MPNSITCLKDLRLNTVDPELEIDFLLDTSLDIIRPYLKRISADLKFIDDTAADLRRTVGSVSVNNLDVGFCHGDCHGSNVHNNKGSLTHFDFDCCGFGFRVFELATFKWGCWNDNNGNELWSSFLNGYRSKREIGAERFGLGGFFRDHPPHLVDGSDYGQCQRFWIQ